MKMYLSSYRLGNNPEKLIQLFQEGKNVGVIMNAIDFATENIRKEKLRKELTELKSLNFIPEEIDLRNYFGKETLLREKLQTLNGLWIRGGNVFLLRRAMQQSGLDKILKEKISDNNFVYAGYSAGICVLSPDLHGLEIMDNPTIVPNEYDKEIIWEGLNILPYLAIPHYQSDHIETAGADEAVTYAEKNNVVYKTLRDGEVIITEVN